MSPIFHDTFAFVNLVPCLIKGLVVLFAVCLRLGKESHVVNGNVEALTGGGRVPVPLFP